MELKVMDKPHGSWMDRLRRGHWVYLPKEENFAKVTYEWEPPEPGTISGRICLDIYAAKNGTETSRFYFQGTHKWFVKGDGSGLDNSQIILPVENNLPYNPEPIPATEIRKIHQALEAINNRIDLLYSCLENYNESSY